MRHHTLFHEVDLNIIEQARARKAENLAVGEGAQKPFVPEGYNKPQISQRNHGSSVITR